MRIPDEVRAGALAHVARFCANRIPDDVRDEIRLEHAVHADSITIFECQPRWRDGIGPEWTRSKVARLRYDPAPRRWSLQWAYHNCRWLVYDGVAPSADVGPLLAEVGADPYGAFWG